MKMFVTVWLKWYIQILVYLYFYIETPKAQQNYNFC